MCLADPGRVDPDNGGLLAVVACLVLAPGECHRFLFFL